ncbi:hypothetical protein H1S01_09300 [Heliobacterium chlorum]|uniref:Uncharacterized protein n=1 Tax=Heliobacterium chlorum TaxID=2698 RepID=A0ABR7T4C2_HELCL|nr:hypothetical protein [Heliobacterium chlorum]MBC9784704.1 hypothetical protein [Heliobacterium chlorum]
MLNRDFMNQVVDSGLSKNHEFLKGNNEHIWIVFGKTTVDQLEDAAKVYSEKTGMTVEEAAGLFFATLLERRS